MPVKKKVALVVGTAPKTPYSHDFSEVIKLLDGRMPTVLLVNRAINYWNWPFDYWCSAHRELLDQYRERFIPLGVKSVLLQPRPDYAPGDRSYIYAPCRGGGSSSYGAVKYALDGLGMEKVITIGVTFEGEYASFKDRWMSDYACLNGRVRAYRGFIAQLFGHVTDTWLEH